tara:strand:+ start:533 stop:673 length:141 start_codon:yes stop_codon:yes gene_type:complete
MDKSTERLTISVSKEDKERLDGLKKALNQNTYSKVIQKLIRHGRIN